MNYQEIQNIKKELNFGNIENYIQYNPEYFHILIQSCFKFKKNNIYLDNIKTIINDNYHKFDYIEKEKIFFSLLGAYLNIKNKEEFNEYHNFLKKIYPDLITEYNHLIKENNRINELRNLKIKLDFDKIYKNENSKTINLELNFNMYLFNLLKNNNLKEFNESFNLVSTENKINTIDTLFIFASKEDNLEIFEYLNNNFNFNNSKKIHQEFIINIIKPNNKLYPEIKQNFNTIFKKYFFNALLDKYKNSVLTNEILDDVNNLYGIEKYDFLINECFNVRSLNNIKIKENTINKPKASKEFRRTIDHFINCGGEVNKVIIEYDLFLSKNTNKGIDFADYWKDRCDLKKIFKQINYKQLKPFMTNVLIYEEIEEIYSNKTNFSKKRKM